MKLLERNKKLAMQVALGLMVAAQGQAMDCSLASAAATMTQDDQGVWVYKDGWINLGSTAIINDDGTGASGKKTAEIDKVKIDGVGQDIIVFNSSSSITGKEIYINAYGSVGGAWKIFSDTTSSSGNTVTVLHGQGAWGGSSLDAGANNTLKINELVVGTYNDYPVNTYKAGNIEINGKVATSVDSTGKGTKFSMDTSAAGDSGVITINDAGAGSSFSELNTKTLNIYGATTAEKLSNINTINFFVGSSQQGSGQGYLLTLQGWWDSTHHASGVSSVGTINVYGKADYTFNNNDIFNLIKIDNDVADDKINSAAAVNVYKGVSTQETVSFTKNISADSKTLGVTITQNSGSTTPTTPTNPYEGKNHLSIVAQESDVAIGADVVVTDTSWYINGTDNAPVTLAKAKTTGTAVIYDNDTPFTGSTISLALGGNKIAAFSGEVENKVFNVGEKGSQAYTSLAIAKDVDFNADTSKNSTMNIYNLVNSGATDSGNAVLVDGKAYAKVNSNTSVTASATDTINIYNAGYVGGVNVEGARATSISAGTINAGVVGNTSEGGFTVGSLMGVGDNSTVNINAAVKVGNEYDADVKADNDGIVSATNVNVNAAVTAGSVKATALNVAANANVTAASVSATTMDVAAKVTANGTDGKITADTINIKDGGSLAGITEAGAINSESDLTLDSKTTVAANAENSLSGNIAVAGKTLTVNAETSANEIKAGTVNINTALSTKGIGKIDAPTLNVNKPATVGDIQATDVTIAANAETTADSINVAGTLTVNAKTTVAKDITGNKDSEVTGVFNINAETSAKNISAKDITIAAKTTADSLTAANVVNINDVMSAKTISAITADTVNVNKSAVLGTVASDTLNIKDITSIESVSNLNTLNFYANKASFVGADKTAMLTLTGKDTGITAFIGVVNVYCDAASFVKTDADTVINLVKLSNSETSDTTNVITKIKAYEGVSTEKEITVTAGYGTDNKSLNITHKKNEDAGDLQDKPNSEKEPQQNVTTGDSTKDSSGDNSVDGTKDSSGDNSVDGTKDSSGDNSVEGAKNSSGDNSVDGTKNSSGDNSVDGTKDSSGDNSVDGTKNSSGDNSVDGTKNSSGDNSVEVTKDSSKDILGVGSGDSGSSDGGNESGQQQLREQTKSLAETQMAALATITSSADMTAGTGFVNAAKAVSMNKTNGGSAATMVPTMAIGGHSMRQNSGSYVNNKGYNISAGFVKEVEYSNNKVMFGPLFEYGHSTYDSHLDDGTRGDGKSQAWALGLMVKQTFDDGLYYEGSIRAGRISTDYSSSNILSGSGITCSYENSTSFYGIHAGVGKLTKLSEKNTLDTYAKLFYTRQNGNEVHLSTGEDYTMHDVSSDRTLLGFRFNHAINAVSTLYAGLAWQYEFEGSAVATYCGMDTLSPSVEGSSGMLELGISLLPQNHSFGVDLGLSAWTGKQEGISANAKFTWCF